MQPLHVLQRSARNFNRLLVNVIKGELSTYIANNPGFLLGDSVAFVVSILNNLKVYYQDYDSIDNHNIFVETVTQTTLDEKIFNTFTYPSINLYISESVIRDSNESFVGGNPPWINKEE